MKLSIITCTLNSEPYVAECIASVREQNYPQVERVFVDGGSTDGMLERIKALDGDVKILENVRGGIARLGTDTLGKVARALTERDAPWLFGRCKSIVNGVLKENDFETKPYSWGALIRRNFVPHTATFYRRAAFQQLGGFDLRYRCAMDYDLWLRLARIGDPVQLLDYLAAFRFHPGSLSTANALMCHNETLRVRVKHTGPHPLMWAEHLARYTVRTYRLLQTPRADGGCRA
jgi:GT2 family glycosyltransferase